MTQFCAKDFIETQEGLCFAIVQNGLEQGKILCFLRYIHQNNRWQKINTAQANHLLHEQYPHYLHYSSILDVNLHAVAPEQISLHHQPRQKLQQLLNLKGLDNVTQDFIELCQHFQSAGLSLNHVGITGSLLIGAQHPDSDIDLVFYNRSTFHQARHITAALMQQNLLQPLNQQDWQSAFARRDCELNFVDYVWHEQRKFNKGIINQRKFDLSLVPDFAPSTESYSKLGKITLKVQVSDDNYSFDYPARFLISHHDISEILCFTATYNGQAQTGEWIEVAGQLEVSDSGQKRIIVGSNREAHGEYIKVLNRE